MENTGGEKDDGAKQAVEGYRQTQGRSKPVEYIGVHNRLSRVLEACEDLVVTLITLTLLALALVFLWRVWVEVVTLMIYRREFRTSSTYLSRWSCSGSS